MGQPCELQFGDGLLDDGVPAVVDLDQCRAAKHLHDRRVQVQGQRGAQVGRTGAYCPEPGQQLPADHIVLPHVAQNAELDRYPFWRPSGPCPAGDWKWASTTSSASLTSSESLAWLLATRRGRDR